MKRIYDFSVINHTTSSWENCYLYIGSISPFFGIDRLFRTEDWQHEMKWKHKLVEIAFRNYNSYVYHDDSLEVRLTRERAEV